MISVVRYQLEHKPEWDEFVGRSKNGVFLFQRDYVEYHSDRFSDHSLLFFKDERLVALMPANVDDESFVSHGGLTFGGIISDHNMKTLLMLELFEALKEYLQGQGMTRLIYKAVPHIYHHVPAEEDLYALFRHDARLVRRDVSSTIDANARLPFSKGRKWAVKQGQKHGLEVKRSFDFETFMTIEANLLGEKYGTKPVHTAAELQMLAARFPDNIKLFTAHGGAEMYAGAVIYESQRVAHAQYIGTTEEGRKTGALDLIMGYLINDYYAQKKYFDFGISTEDGGRHLNAGLIENKQSFGARAVVYDFYELDFQQP
jgi:hypothetical protein